ncbi:hypothetical protein [Methanosphaera sp.]|jgi:metal-responsive CopG/Arc/MetJ family transcriptional regulator|uniref:hypothetical protein n=1 Tax=Methanosphaera sp. TaxID=2666342 RepID=UPI003D8F5A6F
MSVKQCRLNMDESLWNKFSEICGAEHTNCSEKIRELITTYINTKTEETVDLSEVYDLIDNIVQRSGRIAVEVIQRNTTTGQEQEVIEYCREKNYQIVSEKWYEEGPSHKWEDW